MSIRRVQESDVDAVVTLVHQLAGYARATEQCRLTAAKLRAALFGPRPALFGHVAEVDGEIAGIALWFLNFSTWEGVHGVYLEDLFVRPENRAAGQGRELLAALAVECLRHGYSRPDWPAQGPFTRDSTRARTIRTARESGPAGAPRG